MTAAAGASPTAGRDEAAVDRAWAALREHHRRIEGRHLRQLFADDPQRAEELSLDACGLHVDFSKQRITPRTLDLLVDLAEAAGLPQRIEAMLRGERINTTEDRPALHSALRLPREATLVVDGVDVVQQVHAVLDAMAAVARDVRTGHRRGFTGRPLRNIVNIGIGGSDLGPVMAYEALRFYSDRELRFGFVSNVDATDFVETTRGMDPAETLVIVCSKTFTTLETMTNARTARAWIVDALGDEAAVADHFLAVSTNAEAVQAFGIEAASMIGFWDWVGGRYSMDSAIGLSTMIAIGPEAFAELLAGFHDVDEHLRTAPLRQNLPVLHGLIGVWNADILGADTVAVVPYDRYLARFPAYLQQLTMESNGKRVRLDGSAVTEGTGAIHWGEPGTNGQHSFFQLLHQGTRLVPCDFIACVEPLHPVGAHHRLLLANVLAQAQALAFGRTLDEVLATGVDPALAPHRVFEGDRPSTVVLADRLTPRTLGRLVALYEHSVLTQGVVWGIDSFDQWGVELGKTLAQEIEPLLRDPAAPLAGLDASTAALVSRMRGGTTRL